jgi:hypothetical protein
MTIDLEPLTEHHRELGFGFGPNRVEASSTFE